MGGQDGWILPKFLFCMFMDLDFVSVHKLAKKRTRSRSGHLGLTLGQQRIYRPYEKCVLLNYSFVCIQNSLTNLVRENKFFTILVSKLKLEYLPEKRTPTEFWTLSHFVFIRLFPYFRSRLYEFPTWDKRNNELALIFSFTVFRYWNFSFSISALVE